MILFILSLCAAAIFPLSLIKAIRERENWKFYAVVCCISFVVMDAVLLFTLKFLIDNLI